MGRRSEVLFSFLLKRCPRCCFRDVTGQLRGCGLAIRNPASLISTVPEDNVLGNPTEIHWRGVCFTRYSTIQ